MSFRSLLLAGLFLLPVVAEAQPVQGLYISLDTGLNIAGSLSASQDTPEVSTHPGPLGVVDFGWAFGTGLRAEVEGSYRHNDISGISTRRLDGTLQPLGSTQGAVATYAVMANVIYDIPLQPFGLSIRPYVGAGLGYGWLDFGGAEGNGVAAFALPQGNTVTGPSIVRFGSGGAFAYQAMVGAAMPLSIVSGLHLTMEYRFFGMARADVAVNRTAAGGNLVNGAVPSSSTRNGFEIRDNAILIGLLYTFGER